MSDLQLFRLQAGTATELTSRVAPLEKALQSLMEAQMEALLGVRFLATEYETGKTHRGRIDSLGLDENGCPVIVEYKRHSNENVINQGLFYLDWLLDHKAEFRWLVMERLGKEIADKIEWSGTRLLCIAADFTRYDQHAVQQIPRNIELIRYKFFGDDLLLLELVNAQSTPHMATASVAAAPGADKAIATQHTATVEAKEGKTIADHLAVAPIEIRQLYERLSSFLVSLGDDVQEKSLQVYIAFRRLKNFVCVNVQQRRLIVLLRLHPDTVELEDGFSRDVRSIGTWGSGDVELSLRTTADFERARPLLERCYAEN